ncbi:hypothetical protein CIHG_00087 [Coccidioides immitis H538.4]|uniref:Uncharacterized protein n=1 Tax=Coccidioides immitis H538.4 TaxID=396776 RepID=A0A0J8U5M4_COCIT|nr:hypothetical protein CIHG_00087 [Coccidioides immitis H538.4]TPX19229.1 hypothetical protein DIZ76_017015 [Coccidioides immitis]
MAPSSNWIEASTIDTGVRVDPKGVYLLLWDQGMPDIFHWGVLISQTDQIGVLYHQALSGTEWRFVMENKDVSRSAALLVALKVGHVESVDNIWMQYAKERIMETKVEKEFRCKNWAMAAIRELADSGIIGLQPDEEKIERIEEEAFLYAKDCYDMRSRVVYTSAHCVR